jgi:SAM-dependent methyltransferase
VHAVDRDTADAARLVAARGLTNVVLHQRDVLAEPFAERFPAIVAADVLEHFPDTEPIARQVHRWLADDGVLVTSLPTENWLYLLLRRVFGIEKPPDHYFSAAQVEATLARVGFRALRRRQVPLEVPGTSLFLVTAWRRTGDRR